MLRTVNKISARGIGLKLLVSIALAELLIMLTFRLLHVEKLMPPILIDLTDTLVLSIVASVLIFYWVVNPMKIIEERKKAQRALELFRNLVNQSNDALFVIDPESGHFMDMNQAAYTTIGYTREELLAMSMMDVETSIPDTTSWQEHVKEVKAQGHVIFEGQHRRKDGSTFPVEINAKYVVTEQKDYIVAMARNITERKQAEEKAYFLAYYDNLTGLPNRTFFNELLVRTIQYANRYDHRFALFLIDLDDFKRINDTLGHDVGDQLLQAYSFRLMKSIRSSDHTARLSEEKIENIARMGGDEFMVLLNEIRNIRDISRIASRLLQELSEPYNLSGREIFMTASIGIAIYPDDGEDVNNLLKNADTAMYHTKNKGKNNFQFYSKYMNVTALEVLSMENDLHKALEHDEFLLHYQPKADLTTRQIVGMESLVRWNHPDRGLIPPSRFIPIAETSGLIVPIGKFVLRTACMQTKKWQEAGLNITSIAVNLSSRQLEHEGLVDEIYRVIDNAGLSPQCLELEITESTIMQNPEEAKRTLLELKGAGIRIAIDDFGTGYSSLNYLRQLPVDALKIDMSFIKNVVSNSNDAVIVKTIIAMAHSLNLRVIAEGVENEQQLAFLQEHGCDEMQGFLLSPPLPPEEASHFLTE